MFLGQVPIVQGIQEAGDAGKPAILGGHPIIAEAFMTVAKNVARQTAIRNEMLAPTQIVNMKN
ncbi:MAG: Mrp/NBP35 family ATP-binding protein, partial [Saprospiraceae bacterium]|nr:Mrp/NBP35 family ATP-binding protein [Saprospiraceae bacterium]